MNNEAVYQNITELMEQITQKHYDGKMARLATALGVTPTALYNIRDGKSVPSLGLLIKIMRLHGKDIDANALFELNQKMKEVQNGE